GALEHSVPATASASEIRHSELVFVPCSRASSRPARSAGSDVGRRSVATRMFLYRWHLSGGPDQAASDYTTSRRSSWALIATMTVLADISTAAAAGGSKMPCLKRTRRAHRD